MQVEENRQSIWIPAAEPVPRLDRQGAFRQQRIRLGDDVAKTDRRKTAHLVGIAPPREVRGQFPAAASTEARRLA